MVVALVVVLVAAAVVLVWWSPWTDDQRPQSDFVSRDGSGLVLDGRPFAAAGSNNYRPMFSEPVLVDDIMRTAAENNFQVMRVWGSTTSASPTGPTRSTGRTRPRTSTTGTARSRLTTTAPTAWSGSTTS
jgi:hypothetical protein